MAYSYEWPRPAVAVDVVVFTIREGMLDVALVRRKHESAAFPGAWALPGGFLRCGPELEETVEACAARELLEETGMEGEILEQFGVYSAPGRDPRERVISIAFTALIPADRHTLKTAPGSDAIEVRWWSCEGLDEVRLAFDHRQIIEDARRRLGGKLSYGRDQSAWVEDAVLLSGLLPNPFTVADAVEIVSVVKGARVDVPNFRRWFLDERKWTLEKAAAPSGPRESSARRASKRPPAYYSRDGLDELARKRETAEDKRESLRDLLTGSRARDIEQVELFLASTGSAPDEARKFAVELLSRLSQDPMLELSVTRAAVLRIGAAGQREPLMTVKWDPNSNSFICRTDMPHATLQRMLPTNAREALVRLGTSGLSSSEFRLQAYLSNVSYIERIVRAGLS